MRKCVWWANEDNVSCKDFKLRNSIYAKKLLKDNGLEGFTVALLQLHPNPGKVGKHLDDYNDPVYSEALVCNGITKLMGKLYRVSLK